MGVHMNSPDTESTTYAVQVQHLHRLHTCYTFIYLYATSVHHIHKKTVQHCWRVVTPHTAGKRVALGASWVTDTREIT